MIQANTNEYFRLFFETAQAILSARNLQETLDSLVQSTVAALEIKAGGLRLIDEESNNLKQVASFGLSEAYLNKGALNADQSIPEVLEGIVVYVKDAQSDPRIQYPDAMRAEGIKAVLSVPVVAGEKTIGVLRLYSAEPHDYSDEDIEFVSALAEMGGMAIAISLVLLFTGAVMRANDDRRRILSDHADLRIMLVDLEAIAVRLQSGEEQLPRSLHRMCRRLFDNLERHLDLEDVILIRILLK